MFNDPTPEAGEVRVYNMAMVNSNLFNPPTSSNTGFSVLSPSLSYSTGLSWFGSFARSSVLGALEGSITTGSLEIVEAKETSCYGTRNEDDKVIRLTVCDNGFWVRVLMSGGLGCPSSSSYHYIAE